jgi:hypothetical protein
MWQHLAHMFCGQCAFSATIIASHTARTVTLPARCGLGAASKLTPTADKHSKVSNILPSKYLVSKQTTVLPSSIAYQSRLKIVMYPSCPHVLYPGSREPNNYRWPSRSHIVEATVAMTQNDPTRIASASRNIAVSSTSSPSIPTQWPPSPTPCSPAQPSQRKFPPPPQTAPPVHRDTYSILIPSTASTPGKPTPP